MAKRRKKGVLKMLFAYTDIVKRKHKIIPENLPLGKIIEIYGNVDVGKTFVTLEAVAALKNKTILIVDSDRDTTKEKLLKHDLSNAYIYQPYCIEEITDFLNSTIAKGIMFDILVFDSTATLVPKNVREISIDQTSWKQSNVALTSFVQYLIPLLDKHNSLAIFISQNRNTTDNNVLTTGGKALRFHSSVRLLIKEDDIIVTKNKIGTMLLSAT